MLDVTSGEYRPQQAKPSEKAKPKQSPSGDETLLDYSLCATKVRARFIESYKVLDDEKRQILEDIYVGIETFEDRFHLHPGRLNCKHAAWCEAYRLQRLLALIEPADCLISVIGLRLDEADDEKVPTASRLRNTYSELISKNTKKKMLNSEIEAPMRSLLLEIIKDTQWHLSKKYKARTIQRRATYRIIIAAIFSFSLFISPYLIMFSKFILEGAKDFSIEGWVGLAFWTATTAGLFGAFSVDSYIFRENGINCRWMSLKTPVSQHLLRCEVLLACVER